MLGIAVRKLNDNIYAFDQVECSKDIELHVVLKSQIWSVSKEYFDCNQPEVIIKAEMNRYAENLWSLPESEASLPVYASWMGQVLTDSPVGIAALGSTGAENHAAIIVGLNHRNYGVVAYYANENAALSRQVANSRLALEYATLSYDSGFRAMGLEPSTPEVPLVALDPNQRGIPVPTAVGADFLSQFNTAIGAAHIGLWTNTTTQALRALPTDPLQNQLIRLETNDQLDNVEIDGFGRFSTIRVEG
ncbi:MAG: hypothetical protein COB16_17170 [Rhodobacteraceae bacterium]|nr:MAG: hypothetical protein COB16_17170 [Paracoccaceae bacterium]